MRKIPVSTIRRIGQKFKLLLKQKYVFLKKVSVLQKASTLVLQASVAMNPCLMSSADITFTGKPAKPKKGAGGLARPPKHVIQLLRTPLVLPLIPPGWQNKRPYAATTALSGRRGRQESSSTQGWGDPDGRVPRGFQSHPQLHIL